MADRITVDWSRLTVIGVALDLVIGHTQWTTPEKVTKKSSIGLAALWVLTSILLSRWGRSYAESIQINPNNEQVHITVIIVDDQSMPFLSHKWL